MLAVLAILIAVFGLLSRHFLTLRTLQSVVNQVPDLMVIATGMTLVLIAGGIDLSVGSVLALSGVVLGIAMADWGWPLVPAIAICLAVGTLCGLANGLISALWSIPSFIVTLGMLEVARGSAYLAADSQTKYIGPRIEGVAQPLGRLGISPAFLAAMVVVLIGQILLTRTVWGRYIVAVGANEQAARLFGDRHAAHQADDVSALGSHGCPRGGLPGRSPFLGRSQWRNRHGAGGDRRGRHRRHQLDGWPGLGLPFVPGRADHRRSSNWIGPGRRHRAHQTPDHRQRDRPGRGRGRPTAQLDHGHGKRMAPADAFDPARTLNGSCFLRSVSLDRDRGEVECLARLDLEILQDL